MAPEIYDLSIVFVGDINPVIISPFWLAHKGLIQETEGENAKVDIVHNEICKFDLEWASFEITRQRFQIRTTKESFFEVSKDLATSIFRLLKDTPLNLLGINHILHYRLDEEKYEKLGKVLVPFENWESILTNPKLFQLEMAEEKRKDGLNGHYRIRLSPSELIRSFGVSMNLNDQLSKQTEKTVGATEMVDLLNKHWKSSLERAQNISTQLWKNLDL